MVGGSGTEFSIDKCLLLILLEGKTLLPHFTCSVCRGSDTKSEADAEATPQKDVPHDKDSVLAAVIMVGTVAAGTRGRLIVQVVVVVSFAI